MNYNMKRRLVDYAVSRGLNDIAKGGRLSVRRLVNIGAYFADSDYSRHFYALMEKLLADPNSYYYPLISNLVKNIDRECLKTFGINLGYQAFVVGAQTIRQRMAAGEDSISWYCDMPNDGNDAQLENFIQEKTSQGVYFFTFSFNDAEIGSLLPFFFRHPKCAFLLFSASASLDPLILKQLIHSPNVLVSLPADEPGYPETADLLFRAHCHFAAHLRYDAVNLENIKSRRWKTLLSSTHTPYLLLLAGDDIDATLGETIYSDIIKYRMSKDMSVLVFDFFHDLQYVEDILNHKGVVCENLIGNAVIE